VFNKTVDSIVKQFTTMTKDLDTILEREANNMEDINLNIEELDTQMSVCLNTSKRAMEIKNNLLAIIN